MKKTTSKKLSDRLTQYGTLTLAVAGITEGTSQTIVHVDLATTTGYFKGGVDSIDGTPNYPLNFDSNSQVDFYIRGLGNVSNPLARVFASPGFNSFVGVSYQYAVALNDLDPISSMQNWRNAYTNLGVLNANCFSKSEWCDVQDKYLGLRFRIGVDTHYGWVKLDVNASGSQFTVKEYAYVETANVGLTAGQTTLGVDDKDLSKIKIVALNKSIGLYNLSETTNYSIYSMTGKVVLNGNANQKYHVIEATTLASGIYIVELKDPKSNSTMKKKIVLQ